MGDEKVIQRYNDLIAKFGDSPKSLGWTKNRQKLRFKVLTEIFDMKNNHSVLDFGCGFGDMYQYLSDFYPGVNYYGVDINSKLIEMGKSKYPLAELWSKNILESGLDCEYDFILSSGVHNVKCDNNQKFNKDTFELFYNHSKYGFAVNFLSTKVDYKSEDSFHSSPSEILDLAYSYTNRVMLRNDYMPFEFTIYVFKDDSFSKDDAVYSEYRSLLKDMI